MGSYQRFAGAFNSNNNNPHLRDEGSKDILFMGTLGGHDCGDGDSGEDQGKTGSLEFDSNASQAHASQEKYDSQFYSLSWELGQQASFESGPGYGEGSNLQTMVEPSPPSQEVFTSLLPAEPQDLDITANEVALLSTLKEGEFEYILNADWTPAFRVRVLAALWKARYYSSYPIPGGYTPDSLLTIWKETTPIPSPDLNIPEDITGAQIFEPFVYDGEDPLPPQSPDWQPQYVGDDKGKTPQGSMREFTPAPGLVQGDNPQRPNRSEQNLKANNHADTNGDGIPRRILGDEGNALQQPAGSFTPSSSNGVGVSRDESVSEENSLTFTTNLTREPTSKKRKFDAVDDQEPYAHPPGMSHRFPHAHVGEQQRNALPHHFGVFPSGTQFTQSTGNPPWYSYHPPGMAQHGAVPQASSSTYTTGPQCDFTYTHPTPLSLPEGTPSRQPSTSSSHVDHFNTRQTDRQATLREYSKMFCVSLDKLQPIRLDEQAQIKSMTCRWVSGGPCQFQITAENFEAVQAHLQSHYEHDRKCLWKDDKGNICGTKITDQKKVWRHVSQHHMGIRGGKCPVCEKEWARFDQIPRHMDTCLAKCIASAKEQRKGAEDQS